MIQDPVAVERALRSVDTMSPYLRRHVTEFGQDPTAVHRQQVRATLTLIAEQLAVVAEGAGLNWQDFRPPRSSVRYSGQSS